MTRIIVVAGEASGDRYGGRLVERLRARNPGRVLQFFGTGGDAMERAGVDLLAHIRDLARIGPCEALRHLPAYFRIFQALERAAAVSTPEVAILIDFPEFNLRLAKKMRRAGTKVIYYISPQIWAWRTGRIRIVRRYVDKMLVILPFEEEFYRERGVDVEFVGHPILEEFEDDRERSCNREAFLRRFGLDPARPTVALLAGSRASEVEHILPTLVETARRVVARMPSQFVISVAPTIALGTVERITRELLQGDANASWFRIVTSDARDLLANADFALVKSGTSTLEAALVGTPFVIVYKISPVSWSIGNFLIRSPWKGLVNLIAREEVVPEFLQNDATPEALAAVVLEYLGAPAKREEMRARLCRIREQLTARRASEAAAAAVERFLYTTAAAG